MSEPIPFNWMPATQTPHGYQPILDRVRLRYGGKRIEFTKRAMANLPIPIVLFQEEVPGSNLVMVEVDLAQKAIHFRAPKEGEIGFRVRAYQKAATATEKASRAGNRHITGCATGLPEGIYLPIADNTYVLQKHDIIAHTVSTVKR